MIRYIQDSLYDEDIYPNTKHETIIDCAADHFEGVLECIFETGDTTKLFDHLEEVAFYLNVDIKNIPMKIVKKEDANV